MCRLIWTWIQKCLYIYIPIYVRLKPEQEDKDMAVSDDEDLQPGSLIVKGWAKDKKG